VVVADNPGLSQTQLAEAMDVERPNLVVVVDELERRALITRNRVPSDRRAYALHATSNGAQLCARAVAAVTAHEAELFRGIDAQTAKAIVDALDTLHSGTKEIT